jgi:dolichol kinase
MNPLAHIFTADAFWEGLLAAFIVDVIVVLAVLGPAVKYFEKKAWDGTRQG